MTQRSNDVAEESVGNPGSILVDFAVTPFSVKRRSNPSAAFAELMDRFLAATRENDEMAKAFASFKEHFKGVALEQSDAVRLAALEARGAGDLAIKVSHWPLSMGPGLAYMYDAALETLRSTDRPIEPDLIGVKAIRMLERSLPTALPLIGSMSVNALELALNDDRYADRLRDRASELETGYLNMPPPTGPCEFCIMTIKDEHGNVVDVRCLSEDECDLAAGLILFLIVGGLLVSLFEWLF